MAFSEFSDTHILQQLKRIERVQYTAILVAYFFSILFKGGITMDISG